MADITNLREAFLDEIRDIYHAEKQLLKALPKLARAASDVELRAALEITSPKPRTRSAASNRCSSWSARSPRRGPAPAWPASSKRARTSSRPTSGPVLDALIIASAQRAEHYEIAAYGTVAAWADGLGYTDAAELLRETLDEEKTADETLTGLAEAGINAAAGGSRPAPGRARAAGRG